MDPTSQTLLERLRDARDYMAWDQFVSRYSSPLFQFARGKGLDEQAAEELVQEVVVAIFDRRAAFKYDPRKGRFSNYLRVIMAQRIALRHRVAGRRREIAPQDDEGAEFEAAAASPGPDAVFERLFELNLLWTMLDVVRRDVDPVTYQAFELVTLHGVDPADAARALGASRGAVYSAKRRVLARLRELGASYESNGQLTELLKEAVANEMPRHIRESLTESLLRTMAGSTDENLSPI